jgi:hypothetical protein
MISFRRRRQIGLLVTGIAAGLITLLAWLERARLGHASVLTGCTLLAAVMLLALLGVRRRIPVLPLWSVSIWTQIHIYTGLFALAVYLLHVPAIVANGFLEGGLSLVFLAVSASGLYGLYASRTLPQRLTAVQGQHRFDRVAWHRVQIADAARLQLGALGDPSATGVLSGFYQSYLEPFFSERPSLAYVIAPSGVRRQRLLAGLKELDRYLGEESRIAAGHLAALVRRRDDLDYQYALQLRLRVWVLVHSLLSVVLVCGAIVHALLAYRFMG